MLWYPQAVSADNVYKFMFTCLELPVCAVVILKSCVYKLFRAARYFLCLSGGVLCAVVILIQALVFTDYVYWFKVARVLPVPVRWISDPLACFVPVCVYRLCLHV